MLLLWLFDHKWDCGALNLKQVLYIVVLVGFRELHALIEEQAENQMDPLLFMLVLSQVRKKIEGKNYKIIFMLTALSYIVVR